MGETDDLVLGTEKIDQIDQEVGIEEIVVEIEGTAQEIGHQKEKKRRGGKRKKIKMLKNRMN